MKREFLDYVEDVIDAMQKARSFTAGMTWDFFAKDDKTIFAVIRAIEIIGEAVKKIPPDVKTRYSEMPWQDMAGMRDKLIHEYFGADLKTVWDTVTRDIPALLPKFEKIRKDYIT